MATRQKSDDMDRTDIKNEPPSPGQRGRVLIGSHWFPCRVVSAEEVPVYYGGTIRCFKCEFPNGDVVFCGRNSIRPASSFKGRTS